MRGGSIAPASAQARTIDGLRITRGHIYFNGPTLMQQLSGAR